eukprot:CAMPEP_0170594674 /NCGR_PEP_ID=MMETSP0224-20130122/14131_1 /TAXON_ID=285029 /ORGANISM="Togula jolla, Strain CCCM 725" /LENGTH=108 /DNA_ID=CAMNT_0010918757 /DNA_START=69 /DNA_END=395 /DNA_ORIENTATION=+
MRSALISIATAVVLASQVLGAFAECRGQDQFDIIMCKSHMCSECSLEWCTKTCQKVQADHPGCKCESWEGGTYSSGNFQGKGKYGDVGDYSKAGFAANVPAPAPLFSA